MKAHIHDPTKPTTKIGSGAATIRSALCGMRGEDLWMAPPPYFAALGSSRCAGCARKLEALKTAAETYAAITKKGA